MTPLFESKPEAKQFASFPQFITSFQTAGLGLEPRYYAPEAYVLPLDDPAIRLPVLPLAGPYTTLYLRNDWHMIPILRVFSTVGKAQIVP